MGGFLSTIRVPIPIDRLEAARQIFYALGWVSIRGMWTRDNRRETYARNDTEILVELFEDASVSSSLTKGDKGVEIVIEVDDPNKVANVIVEKLMETCSDAIFDYLWQYRRELPRGALCLGVAHIVGFFLILKPSGRPISLSRDDGDLLG